MAIDPAEIGPELVIFREAKIPWKMLEARYELGRTRLTEIYNAELDRRADLIDLTMRDIRKSLAQIEGFICRLEIEQGRLKALREGV